MDRNSYAIALDVGGRRIGVAVASGIARIAAPLPAIDRQKTDDIYQEISNVVSQQQASVVVVGLPRGLEGQETGQTAIAREFALELGKHIDKPIIMQDEAGTSVEAEQLLRNRGKEYSKGDIDSEAAALILRDYLQQSVGNIS